METMRSHHRSRNCGITWPHSIPKSDTLLSQQSCNTMAVQSRTEVLTHTRRYAPNRGHSVIQTKSILFLASWSQLRENLDCRKSTKRFMFGGENRHGTLPHFLGGAGFFLPFNQSAFLVSASGRIAIYTSMPCERLPDWYRGSSSPWYHRALPYHLKLRIWGDREFGNFADNVYREICSVVNGGVAQELCK